MYSPQVVEFLARERQSDMLRAAEVHRLLLASGPAAPRDGAGSLKRTVRSLLAWLRPANAPAQPAARSEPAPVAPQLSYPKMR